MMKLSVIADQDLSVLLLSTTGYMPFEDGLLYFPRLESSIDFPLDGGSGKLIYR